MNKVKQFINNVNNYICTNSTKEKLEKKTNELLKEYKTIISNLYNYKNQYKEIIKELSKLPNYKNIVPMINTLVHEINKHFKIQNKNCSNYNVIINLIKALKRNFKNLEKSVSLIKENTEKKKKIKNSNSFGHKKKKTSFGKHRRSTKRLKKY